VDVNTQSERCHRHTKGYVKSTAQQVLAALITEKGYETLAFCVRTINNLLNRNGYTLKKVRKTLPQKRIPETDAIFNNIAAHRTADPIGVLKISIDAKDNVAVGPSSRNGYSRTLSAVKAADKDFEQTATLIPFGIVEIASGQATVVVGNSAETSDFVGDALATWYEIKKADMIDKGIHTLEIYLDNGPSVASSRTQFINRIIEFSCISGLNVHLLYYPPYHSKYNPIERVWAAVEQYWNGTILDAVDKVIDTLGNVSWKQQKINAILIDKHYEKKVTLSDKEMKLRKPFLSRNTDIPKWDVLIKYNHQMGSLFFS
jgi:Rhodopirellula transposase DDE domain